MMPAWFSTSFSAFKRNSDGVVAIEAALIFPLLIALGLGASDFSNMLLQRHRMEAGLVSAGVYMSKSRSPKTVESSAKNLALNGQISGGKSKVKGWTASDITIAYKQTNNAANDYRSGDVVTVVQLSSALEYRGLGVINGIIPGGRAIIKVSYEERLTAAAQS